MFVFKVALKCGEKIAFYIVLLKCKNCDFIALKPLNAFSVALKYTKNIVLSFSFYC